jgi:predicted RNA binding protein with dsRBD fold (UPF0201 family)
MFFLYIYIFIYLYIYIYIYREREREREREQNSLTLRFTNCKSTVESFTGKLVKHTRKLCQARKVMAKGKCLQKIQWNKMAKAEKGNINPVRTTSSSIAPHIVTLSTTRRRMVKFIHWLIYPLGTSHHYLLIGEGRWAHEPSWTFWRQISCPPEIKSHIMQPIAYSLTNMHE